LIGVFSEDGQDAVEAWYAAHPTVPSRSRTRGMKGCGRPGAVDSRDGRGRVMMSATPGTITARPEEASRCIVISDSGPRTVSAVPSPWQPEGKVPKCNQTVARCLQIVSGSSARSTTTAPAQAAATGGPVEPRTTCGPQTTRTLSRPSGAITASRSESSRPCCSSPSCGNRRGERAARLSTRETPSCHPVR
jgi:hypothetical protein